MPVWDTSVASGLHPEEPLFELVGDAALSDDPVLVAAPTVAEISYGLQRKAKDERFEAMLEWFSEIFAARVLRVLPLTYEAALLAGRVRALHPTPPSGRGKGDGRSKPDRRVAWVADIQIATSAWLAGEPLCTRDRGHFEFLRSAIADLHPNEGELELLPAP